MEATLTKVESELLHQMSLVTIAQLDKAGIGRGQRRSLVDRRVLQRVRRNVFGLVGVPDSFDRRLMAAILAVEGDVTAGSGAGAARLWEFMYLPEGELEISALTASPPRLAGVVVRRTTRFFDGDLTEIRGIPVTSFERTLCDCSTRLSVSQLGRVLDDGLRREVASLPKLRLCAERLESGPGRHMASIRALLEQRDASFDPGGSRSELRVLELIRAAGLPEPVQQFVVKVDEKKYILDYAWPALRAFVEWYGLPFHIGASAVEHDNDRLTDLVGVGWAPAVFTSGASDRKIVSGIVRLLRNQGWTGEPGCVSSGSPTTISHTTVV